MTAVTTLTPVQSTIEQVRETLGPLGASVQKQRPLVVALSGGLDSCVLLHVLRFHVDPPLPLLAAHFDHAMRDGSRADAQWVEGLCRAWCVPVKVERSTTTPRSEESARAARYAFLRRVAADTDARAIATAHHADDQAETVLFRILRGTGLEGLRGIPQERAPGVVRPLLELWREDLERYADAVRLRWRDDPTNEILGPARNLIRHRLLPMAESGVSSGARRALVRLASIAERNEEAWRELMPDLLARLEVRPGAAPSVDREALRGIGASLRGRVLRQLAAEVGIILDESGTRRAVEFVEVARSGAGIELGRGVTLRRELERFVLQPAGEDEDAQEDSPLTIHDVGPGEATVVLGGHARRCVWSRDTTVPSERAIEGKGRERGLTARFALEQIDFPLEVRRRKPGDRIRTLGGTKKVKKLMLEARIPSGDRDTVPVVAEASGTVLWVPGLVRSLAVREKGVADTLRITFDDLVVA